jgi:Flp pilus assembly pilin Flp
MSSLHHLIRDDRGQDLVEYVLLGATVALASLVLMNVFPGVMNAVYVSWINQTQALWYPQNPAN